HAVQPRGAVRRRPAGNPAQVAVESPAVAKPQTKNLSPRIENRRAWHEYHIESKLECGIVLQGSEVKSLREGKAQFNDSFARVERGELIMYQCHIDPYAKSAIVYNHEPTRPRRLLAHRREIHK